MTNVPDWLIATGLVGAVLFGLLSAFFPPLNAEIYALAAPVIFPDAWVVHVCAMTGGLVVGKMSHFFVAEKGAEAYTRRREAKEAREAAEDRRPTGPVRARFARWSKAMIDVLDRPRLGPLVMLASSGIGFPPLAVVTVAAGQGGPPGRWHRCRGRRRESARPGRTPRRRDPESRSSCRHPP